MNFYFFFINKYNLKQVKHVKWVVFRSKHAKRVDLFMPGVNKFMLDRVQVEGCNLLN
jgi:hypothetical protein